MATLSGVTSPRIRMAIPGLFAVELVTHDWREYRRKDLPREGMTHHEIPVNAQLLSKLANLVLEELSKRLNEFQLRRCVSKRGFKDRSIQ